jgi:hypothetical protein
VRTAEEFRLGEDSCPENDAEARSLKPRRLVRYLLMFTGSGTSKQEKSKEGLSLWVLLAVASAFPGLPGRRERPRYHASVASAARAPAERRQPRTRPRSISSRACRARRSSDRDRHHEQHGRGRRVVISVLLTSGTTSCTPRKKCCLSGQFQDDMVVPGRRRLARAEPLVRNPSGDVQNLPRTSAGGTVTPAPTAPTQNQPASAWSRSLTRLLFFESATTLVGPSVTRGRPRGRVLARTSGDQHRLNGRAPQRRAFVYDVTPGTPTNGQRVGTSSVNNLRPARRAPDRLSHAATPPTSSPDPFADITSSGSGFHDRGLINILDGGTRRRLLRVKCAARISAAPTTGATDDKAGGSLAGPALSIRGPLFRRPSTPAPRCLPSN